MLNISSFYHFFGICGCPIILLYHILQKNPDFISFKSKESAQGLKIVNYMSQPVNMCMSVSSQVKLLMEHVCRKCLDARVSHKRAPVMV